MSLIVAVDVSSSCFAAYPPSSSIKEIPGNSVALPTWVVSDIIPSPLSEHPQLVVVPTQPVDGLTPLHTPNHHDVECEERC